MGARKRQASADEPGHDGLLTKRASPAMLLCALCGLEENMTRRHCVVCVRPECKVWVPGR